jgi:hypothetical protein
VSLYCAARHDLTRLFGISPFSARRKPPFPQLQQARQSPSALQQRMIRRPDAVHRRRVVAGLPLARQKKFIHRNQ